MMQNRYTVSSPVLVFHPAQEFAQRIALPTMYNIRGLVKSLNIHSAHGQGEPENHISLRNARHLSRPRSLSSRTATTTELAICGHGGADDLRPRQLLASVRQLLASVRKLPVCLGRVKNEYR